jgi:cell shape-determining protein MreC
VVCEQSGHDGPSRRDAIKYGGALVTSGLLAGCASGVPISRVHVPVADDRWA